MVLGGLASPDKSGDGVLTGMDRQKQLEKMLSLDGFNELVQAFMASSYSQDKAADYAARMGDTPEEDENGLVVIRDDAGSVIDRIAISWEDEEGRNSGGGTAPPHRLFGRAAWRPGFLALTLARAMHVSKPARVDWNGNIRTSPTSTARVPGI